MAASTTQQLNDILKDVERTPGWKVDYSNKSTVKIYPPAGVAAPFTIHRTIDGAEDNVMFGHLRRLRQHGWTPEMADAKANGRRNKRLSAHQIEAARAEAAIERANQEANMAAAKALASQFSDAMTEGEIVLPFGAKPGTRAPRRPYWVAVTPAWAREMLERDHKVRQDDGSINRRVASRRVEEHIAEMKAGQWKRVHQGVAITKEGKILDGQHRLLAVAAANKTVGMWIFFDTDEDTFDVIDTGRARTVADALHIDHEVNTMILAATARQWWLYHNFDEYEWGHSSRRLSGPTARKIVAEHPELREYIKMAQRNNLKRIMRIPSVALAMYLCLQAWPGEEATDKMIDFLHGVATGNDFEGDGLKATDPRKRLHAVMTNYRETRRQQNGRFHTAIFIKAWNLYCRDQGVTTLGLRTDERVQTPYRPNEDK